MVITNSTFFLRLVMPKMITRKKGFQWKKPTDPLLYQRTASLLKRSLETETKWNILKNFSTRSMLRVRGNVKKCLMSNVKRGSYLGILVVRD